MASPASSLIWHEVALSGRTAAEYERQINDLEPFLAQHWKASVSKKSGNPIYERQVVLVLYLQSCRFLLDQIIPRQGAIRANYDLVIASQPYRARASAEFKAKKVVAPLALALAPGGRLVGIHSCGRIQVWSSFRPCGPRKNPSQTIDEIDCAKRCSPWGRTRVNTASMR
ncbi:hypothetical protein QA645_38750 [Bradyrhizobium sp. CIAT3101]|uniref:hypothetical protein n=1 Tax=Bradyrhizobium sp. CIAT3101 TaxID=439387 RepID=UPI0024B1D49B|nr:hypothetical protein [Bradyrhizobium sp. CIAT3101]WFU80375.1 hypothetical protein QA645_38750 [Bradyrhizobium sp. CIAT3101]